MPCDLVHSNFLVPKLSQDLLSQFILGVYNCYFTLCATKTEEQL